jgi:hypothetical protein
MKTFKYRFEQWPQPLPGGYGVHKNEIGTIRTAPENYYVASVYLDLSIRFDPIEAATRDVDRAGVTKWWNALKATLNVAKVTTMNLSTGAERVYVGLTPAQAVVAAYYQAEIGNFNTWNYDWSKAKVSDSGKTVACGDWTAVLDRTAHLDKVAKDAITAVEKSRKEFPGIPSGQPRKGPEMTKGRR